MPLVRQHRAQQVAIHHHAGALAFGAFNQQRRVFLRAGLNQFIQRRIVRKASPVVAAAAAMLRDKLDNLPMATPGSAPAAAPSASREATEALLALGYKPAEVNRMVKDVAEADMPAEEIIRAALQKAAAA